MPRDTEGRLWDALEAIWLATVAPALVRSNRALVAALRDARPISPESARAVVLDAAEQMRATGLPWHRPFVEGSFRAHAVGMLASACEASAQFAESAPCSEAWLADAAQLRFHELEALLVRRLDWMNEERITELWQRWEYEETPAVHWSRRQAQVAFEQMRRGLQRGDSTAQIIDAIEVAFGHSEDSFYVETVVRTNVASALGQGRVDAIQAIAEPGDVVVYQAVLDDRTRPEHASLDGRVFEAGSELHHLYAPPLGYNCRCTLRFVNRLTAQRKKLTEKIERAPVVINGEEYTGDPGFETARIPSWRVTPKRVKLPRE